MRIFTDVSELDLEAMSSEELREISAKITGEFEAVKTEYRRQQAPLQRAIDAALQREKAARDRDPAYRARAQVIGS